MSIYYVVEGEGDPLLMIPCLATDVTQVGAIVRELSRRHLVIAIDTRGTARSDKPDVPYSIGAMAEDAAGLLANSPVW